MNSGRRTPDGVTQRPAFLRTLSIEPDSPGPGTFGDDPAAKSPWRHVGHDFPIGKAGPMSMAWPAKISLR